MNTVNCHIQTVVIIVYCVIVLFVTIICNIQLMLYRHLVNTQHRASKTFVSRFQGLVTL